MKKYKTDLDLARQQFLMVKDGFPLCYKIKGNAHHCRTCIERWKNLKCK